MSIIKSGPVFKFDGYVPQRIVLRELRDRITGEVREYVVHGQGFTSDGSYFLNGNYFPVWSYGELAKTLAEAKFEERLREKLTQATPQDYQHPEAIEVIRRLSIDPQMAKVA